MGSAGRVFLLLTILVLPTYFSGTEMTVRQNGTQVFSDDFNYSSLSDLQGAGYVIQRHPELVSIAGGLLTLKNTGAVNGYVTYTNLNVVSDWKVEARLTVLSGYFSIQLDVYVDGVVPGYANPGYFYHWGADGYPGRESFSFIKYEPSGVGMNTATVPGYTPQAFGTWVTLAVERVSNQLRFYYNDNLVTTAIETHNVILTGFGLGPWWPTVTEFDNIVVSSNPSPFPTTYTSAAQSSASITATTGAVSSNGFTSVYTQYLTIRENDQLSTYASIATIVGTIAAISLGILSIYLQFFRKKKTTA